MKINKNSWHFKWIFGKTQEEDLPQNICEYLFWQLFGFGIILFLFCIFIPGMGLSILGLSRENFENFSYFIFTAIDNFWVALMYGILGITGIIIVISGMFGIMALLVLSLEKAFMFLLKYPIKIVKHFKNKYCPSIDYE